MGETRKIEGWEESMGKGSNKGTEEWLSPAPKTQDKFKTYCKRTKILVMCSTLP